MSAFHTRNYTDNAEPYHPFKDEFKNNSVLWFKAHYRIEKNLYESRTAQGDFPRLIDVLNPSQMSIFRDYPNLDRSRYRLLDDTDAVFDKSNNWWDVTELYGYTPATILHEDGTVTTPFRKGGSTPWTRPGWRYLRGNIPEIVINSITSIESNTRQSIVLASTAGLSAGDEIVLHRDVSAITIGQTTTTFLAGETTPVVILSINYGTNTIVISTEYEFNVTMFTPTPPTPIPGTNTGVQAWWNPGLYNGAQFISSNPRLFIGGQTAMRPAEARDYPCIVATHFFTYNEITAGVLPDVIDKKRIYSSGNETDTLDTVSKPSISEFEAMVANKESWIANPATPRKVAGDVWRYDIPLVRCV